MLFLLNQSSSISVRRPSSTQPPRSRSPGDQIVTLSSDDAVDGVRAVRGTDSPGSSTSAVSSNSSGSSGYSVILTRGRHIFTKQCCFNRSFISGYVRSG